MKQPRAIRAPRITHSHWLLLGMLLVVSGLFLSIRSNDNENDRSNQNENASSPWVETQSLALPSVTGDAAHPSETARESMREQVAEQWRTIKVKSGDSLATIFTRVGLNPQLLHTILSLGDETENLKRIHPGQIIKLKLA